MKHTASYGKWTNIYRAIDQDGQVIDAYFSKRRKAKAAQGFNGMERDYEHLKQCPKRGFKQITFADTIAGGNALIRNLHTRFPDSQFHLRLAAAWPQLACVI